MIIKNYSNSKTEEEDVEEPAFEARTVGAGAPPGCGCGVEGCLPMLLADVAAANRE